jgi:hypothetical protein
MVGTLDVRQLEPSVYGSAVGTLPINERERRFKESLVAQLLAVLGPKPVEEPGPLKLPDPKAAFAVKGNDMDALRAAHATLVHDIRPAQLFNVGQDISIVFYSYQAGCLVQIREVQRHGSVIQIRYQFVPHALASLTSHFALIPMGKLRKGNYEIEIIQTPMDRKLASRDAERINEAWERQLICKPFSFSIVE